MNHKKLLASLLLATSLAAPASAEVVFRWANDGDVRAMDPNTIDETVQNSFLSGIYEPLVRRSKTLGTEPSLAVKWENPSPSVWRFHLRPGVKWQDGTPFTADDVLFTYKRTTSKTSATSGNLASVKEVRKVDDLTVDFETKAPEPILDAWLTNVPIMPKHWMETNTSAEAVTMGEGMMP